MPLILPLNYPDNDGEQFSRTSVTLSAVATATRAGVTQQIAQAMRIEGWIEWKYKRSLKPGKSWNNKATPQARTRGPVRNSDHAGPAVSSTRWAVVGSRTRTSPVTFAEAAIMNASSDCRSGENHSPSYTSSVRVASAMM